MIIKEGKLATRKSKIEVKMSWQVVCGEYEYQDFLHTGKIHNFRWKDTRHEMFDRMKWPQHTIWQGPWGPEPLYWPKQDNPVMGRLGIIWCSDRRAEEIRANIQDQIKVK